MSINELNAALRHHLTPEQVENIADLLSTRQDWRKVAGKIIAKGRRNLSDDCRERKAELCRARAAARREKGKI